VTNTSNSYHFSKNHKFYIT